MMRRALTVALGCCLLLASVPLGAAKCDTDALPAATLLVPYFEVDLNRAGGPTTLFSVVNQDAAPVLANVVLWTDWAVPTLSFQIYLAGFDTQTVNLRDVLGKGWIPVTGSAVSPHSDLSEPPVEFPGCNNTTEPGTAPVYPRPAFTEAELEEARAWHRGLCFDGRQAGSRRGSEGVAHGYVTIDTVQRCSESTPADTGYFGTEGVADVRNALTGDYFLIDPSEDYAQGETAVHIEAFPDGFGAGDYTFYERYVEGSALDAREPLGTQYAVRHLVGGAFDGGTRLIVWRDTGSPDASPVEGCGAPGWFNLGGLESYIVFLDETGRGTEQRDTCSTLPPCAYPFRYATQAVGLAGGEGAEFDLEGSGFELGVTRLVLRRANGPDPADWEVLQGWVSVTSSAENRYSIGQRSFRLDSACDPGEIEPVGSE